MRPATLLLPLVLATAGCVDVPAGAQDAGADAGLAALEPFLAEGTVFLPPSRSQERVETLLPFPVNATGSSIVAHAALGSRYGPLETPPALADVLVELRAPDGTVLAEGAIRMQQTEVRLELADATATGEHALALLSYGGSDAEANGDYVAWIVEVAPTGIS